MTDAIKSQGNELEEAQRLWLSEEPDHVVLSHDPDDASASTMIKSWMLSGQVPTGSLNVRRFQERLLEAGLLQRVDYGSLHPDKTYWSPSELGTKLGIALRKEIRDNGVAAWPVYPAPAREQLLAMIISDDFSFDPMEDQDEDRETMEVILLTKSTKHGGYCVAGIETTTGDWVRLMTNDDEFPNGAGALSEAHLTAADGVQAGPLDVVRFNVAQRCPEAYQTENVEVDFSTPLRILRKATIDEVLLKHPAEGREKLFYTQYDTLKEELADKIDYSLVLVRVTGVHLYPKKNSRGNVRARADFTYVPSDRSNRRVRYKEVRVTIPEYDNMTSELDMDEAYFVLSVGLPWEGRIYKYVAAIYPIEKAARIQKASRTPKAYVTPDGTPYDFKFYGDEAI